MSKKLTLFVTVLLHATFLLAQKQDTLTSSNPLDELVVTANKVPQKQSTTGKVVTVISREKVIENSGRSLFELLNNQAGFFINGANNALGTNLDFYFRGAKSGYTLIVIDGIPVNDPSTPNNTFDLNTIPLQQIERIEILKGGQSTLWGSDAIAGVVQIFLKKGEKKKFGVNGSYSAGSFGTNRIVTGVSGNIKKIGYNFQWNRIKSKGISSAYDSTGTKDFDKDAYKQNSIQASVDYKINTHFSARAFGNFSKYTNGVDGGAFTDDKDYNAKNINNVGGLNVSFKGNKCAISLQGSFQRTNRTFTNDSGNISSPYSKYSYDKYKGNTASIENFGNIELSKHISLIGGLQYINQNTEQFSAYIGSGFADTSKLGKDSSKIYQLSGYVTLLFKTKDGFHLEVGGRLNNHSIYGTNATFSVNPSYNVDENTKLFLNISTAYKAASLYQLYINNSYIQGSKDLKAETSTNYEFGLQTTTSNKQLYLRLVGFKRDVENLITTYSDAAYRSYYINQDKQSNYGFEIETSVKLAKFGNWSNNFTFIDGEGTVNNLKVNNLYRIPKFTVNSSLSLTPYKGFMVSPSFKYIGTRLKNPYDVGPTELPAYYTIDCYLGYKIFKNNNLFIDFHNITNQEYFDIPGYNSKRFNMMAGINIQL
jgi:vitamin B12 transporter